MSSKGSAQREWFCMTFPHRHFVDLISHAKMESRLSHEGVCSSGSICSTGCK